MNIITASIKKGIDSVSEKTRLDKKLLAIIAIGFAGICALLLSEIVPAAEKRAEADTTVAVQETDYAADIEARLADIIASIDGAGRVKVMVTLESSGEEIYLRDRSISSNSSENSRISSDEVNKYIIIDSGEGEGGIVAKVISPKVRGVAVVCDGAGSALVKQSVIDTVTALLNISSARVSVTKMH